MPITIKDLARLTKTSPATVSRVLSSKAGVAPEKREAILRLARQLGYQPDRSAQSLVRQQALYLGLIVAELRNPTYTGFLRQVERFARERGYEMLVADSGLDIDRERKNVESMLQHRAAGLVIFPVADWLDPCNHGHLLQLQQQHFPFVIAGKLAGLGLNCVYSEELHASQALTEHLIGLGHRRFGFVGAEARNRPAREREEGVRRALVAAGLMDDLYSANGGPLLCASHTLDPADVVRQWFSLEFPPTALIAVNSELMLRYYRPLAEAGLSIPGDVSLAAFDDMSWCPFVMPSLTVAASDQSEVAEVALKTLFGLVEHPDAAAADLPVPKRLYLRESTDAPPSAVRRVS